MLKNLIDTWTNLQVIEHELAALPTPAPSDKLEHLLSRLTAARTLLAQPSTEMTSEVFDAQLALARLLLQSARDWRAVYSDGHNLNMMVAATVAKAGQPEVMGKFIYNLLSNFWKEAIYWAEDIANEDF